MSVLSKPTEILRLPGSELPQPGRFAIPCAAIDLIYDHNLKRDAQLSQRDRAAGCVIVFAKSKRLELGDNILQTL